MGFLKQLSGWTLKIASVPYNRLIKGHTVANANDWTDKQYVDNLVATDVNGTIAGIMARMGLVVIPTNIVLSPFPNPITVNGRSYTLVNKQRVLLIGQTTTSENGVYEVFGTNLIRVNDYDALNGIYFNSNQIGVSRWNDVLNALRFNGSGQLQVKVRNSGTNVFTGFQVDPSTGEMWIDVTTMPGFGSGLIVEYLLSALGSTLKLNFDSSFLLSYNGGAARTTVGLAAGVGVQTGTIVDEAFNTAAVPAAPSGYLLCNGQTVDGNNALYTALLAKLQSTFITNVEINRPPQEPSIAITSNSQAGYISTASTTLGSSFPFNAFDGLSTDWISGLWTTMTTPATAGGDWVRLELPTAMLFSAFTVSIPGTPQDWKMQASNDGSSWTDLGALKVNSNGGTYTNVDNTPYKYYRILVTQLYGGGNRAQVREVIFQRPLYSPIRFFQVPNLSNPATGVRRIIKI